MNNSFLFFLISVVLISLSGVIMPGPLFAVTVAKAYKNKKSGAFIAFGHGIIEIPLMVLIYLGFAKLFNFQAVKIAAGIVGGITLIYLGSQMWRRKAAVSLAGKDSNYRALTAGIITTAANPYFFIWWLSIGAALILGGRRFGFLGFCIFALVHWLCDFFWYWFVSQATFRTKHLWNSKTQGIIIGVSACVLIAFGLWFILSIRHFLIPQN